MFLTSVVQGESKSSQCPTGAAVQTSTFTHGEAAPPPVYKVVTVGGGGVGKSSLVVQFMYGEVIVHNKHQSNLVKSGIVFRFYLSNMQLFWLEFRPQIFPSPGGQGPPSTQCVIGPHKCTCQMAAKFVEWFKQGARM